MNSNNLNLPDYESFMQRLDQNEKIYEILRDVSSFIPDLYLINNNSDFSEAISPLVKIYAKQLNLIEDNSSYTNTEILSKHPSLKWWLKFLNISDESIEALLTNANTFYCLYDKNENDLKEFLNGLNIPDEEIRVICSAFYCLKIHHENSKKLPKISSSLTDEQLSASSINLNEPSSTQDIQSTDNNNKNNSNTSIFCKNANPNNLTVPQATSSINLNQSTLTSSTSSAAISQYSSNTSRAKQQRKSESDISQNIISTQNQHKNLNVSPVHYPPTSSKLFPGTNAIKNQQQPQKTNRKTTNKANTTPPPSRKNSTSTIGPHNINLSPQNINNNLQNSAISSNLNKNSSNRSLSYESQSRIKIDSNNNEASKTKPPNYQQNNDLVLNLNRRLSTEGSECSSKVPSGQTSPINISSPNKAKASSIFVSRSPKHSNLNPGEHSWSTLITLVTNCQYCQKKMLFGIRCKICKFIKYVRINNIKKCDICLRALWHGLKCKNCKVRCHKDCEKKNQSMCSPNGLTNFAISNQGPIYPNDVSHINNKNSCESSSNASSCNSSGPNSPNNLKPNKQIPSYNSQPHFIMVHTNSSNNLLQPNTTPPSPAPTASSSSNLTTPLDHSLIPKSQFFPLQDHDNTEDNNNNNRNLIPNDNSDYNLDSNYASNDMIKSSDLDINQNDSNDNIDNNSIENFENNNDYGDFNDNHSLMIAQSLKECNITYSEITEKVLIGEGLFGKTYKAQWHGPHAVKELELDPEIPYTSEKFKLFKIEILNLIKTRHANLILFVGACMEPPQLAIVMSLCRGVTLFRYLHLDAYPKPNPDWTINIATQIAQGMGYLHTKKMLHKDLKSKNIFIDGNKAVISDFGLVATAKLCKKLRYNDSLIKVKKESIYYLAPEIMCALGRSAYDLPFSEASDIYAFGTVWYELLYYEYPFFMYDVHTIIYLVGNGSKYLSPHIQIAKELKNILLKCWSKEPEARPQFSNLLEIFRAVPKRRLYRSPSHPQIGRSLEAIHINDKLK